MMSGLLLSARSRGCHGRVLTPQRDPVAEKLLGAPATSRRAFNRPKTLAWMTEIYDNSPPKQPKQIDVSARLIDEAGRDAFASRDVLANGDSRRAEVADIRIHWPDSLERRCARTISAARGSPRSQRRRRASPSRRKPSLR